MLEKRSLVPPPPPNKCPSGVDPVQCIVDPCQIITCTNPRAICVADYCGGRNARFYLDGKEITDTGILW